MFATQLSQVLTAMLPHRAWLPRCAWLQSLAAVMLIIVASPSTFAYTPESPEVRAVIDKALKFLNEQSDDRLGGKCLLALAFLKNDQPDHPKIQEALAACRKNRAKLDHGEVYSNGLALIFLCELNARRHEDLVKFYLSGLRKRQKDHGGWGYDKRSTGDTSQTQYGTLGLWEAHQNNFEISHKSVKNCLQWIINTQDPSGAWGYQGKIGSPDNLIKQQRVGLSMVAAGLSSLLVCADLYGLLRPGSEQEDLLVSAPEGLTKQRDGSERTRAQPIPTKGIDREQLFRSLGQGQGWMDKNFKINARKWNAYYMYSVERYKSFEELLSVELDTEPDWYNEGFKLLARHQQADGSWDGTPGKAVETAFSVLFLLRSTQKTLRRGFGEGVMVSGRGAPSDIVRKKKVRIGNKLVDATSATLKDLVSALGDGQADVLDAISSDPTAFAAGDVDEKTARRLQQLVRSGEPPARLLAVRSLGQTAKLDYVPTLLFAFTDPDQRVALEARDSLRLISRRFEGYGLPDNFTDRQRYEVLDKWKTWYLTFRPNAVLE